MSTLVSRETEPYAENESLLDDQNGDDPDEVVNQVRGGSASQAEGTSSIVSSIFNLVNNVAGAGILTLAAGMATGTGWIPAVGICTALGALGAHTFSIIGEACELTGEVDFKVSSTTTDDRTQRWTIYIDTHDFQQLHFPVSRDSGAAQ